MNFALLGHLLDKNTETMLPRGWIRGGRIVSPAIRIAGTCGYLICLPLTARQMMDFPVGTVRRLILDSAIHAQDQFGIELIQLGALTTSVTAGGLWLTEQEAYSGYVNHGDSYTAAVTCQAVEKMLSCSRKDPEDIVLAVVGATGIIGAAVTRNLARRFKDTLLIGRRLDRLADLAKSLDSPVRITTDLAEVKKSDVIITATNHPEALLKPKHLKKHAVVIDVSQPPNLSAGTCRKRPDVLRIDGGIVDTPGLSLIPGFPPEKCFACMAEAVMQALEDERAHHVGSIDPRHLKKTVGWSEKYGYKYSSPTSFGIPVGDRILAGNG